MPTFSPPQEGVSLNDTILAVVEAHGRTPADVVQVFANHPENPTAVLVQFVDSSPIPEDWLVLNIGYPES